MQLHPWFGIVYCKDFSSVKLCGGHTYLACQAATWVCLICYCPDKPKPKFELGIFVQFNKGLRRSLCLNLGRFQFGLVLSFECILEMQCTLKGVTQVKSESVSSSRIQVMFVFSQVSFGSRSGSAEYLTQPPKLHAEIQFLIVFESLSHLFADLFYLLDTFLFCIFFFLQSNAKGTRHAFSFIACSEKIGQYCSLKTHEREREYFEQDVQIFVNFDLSIMTYYILEKITLFVMELSSQPLNRSPAIVIAYLMKCKGWRLAQSYQWVKDRRPVVEISPGLSFPRYSSFIGGYVFELIFLNVKRLFESATFQKLCTLYYHLSCSHYSLNLIISFVFLFFVFPFCTNQLSTSNCRSMSRKSLGQTGVLQAQPSLHQTCNHSTLDSQNPTTLLGCQLSIRLLQLQSSTVLV